MSGKNAHRSARTPNPYADTPEHSGARRGAFSCVLCETSRLWRRPLARRLSVGRNNGQAARWQGEIEDGEAGCGVPLSPSLGTPEPQPPKKVYHTPHPRAVGTPLVSRAKRDGFPTSKYPWDSYPEKCNLKNGFPIFAPLRKSSRFCYNFRAFDQRR